MLDLYDKIQEACSKIRHEFSDKPKVGIILGTGLGDIVEELDVEAAIDYQDIPHFLTSTATSHRGRLVCGVCRRTRRGHGGPLSSLRGLFTQRYHAARAVFKELGAELMIVNNACGGLNPYFDAGDLMVISQINLLGDNPLIGINDDRLGPRFPDMCEPMIGHGSTAYQIARERDINIHRCLCRCCGAESEARAEYRYLRMIGADVVGMSTVPEAIVAVHCGLKTVGLSVVTDMCLPDALKPANVEEIIAVANEATPKLIAVVDGIVREFNHTRMA